MKAITKGIWVWTAKAEAKAAELRLEERTENTPARLGYELLGQYAPKKWLELGYVKELKTYEQWTKTRQDISKYLQLGDLVDEEMVEYFVNVLPPACMTGGIVQIGEPDDYVEGRATYQTLKRTPGGWIYAGTCHRGEAEHKQGLIIAWN